MARPRNDGTAPRQPNRRNLTELFVRKIRPDAAPFNVWDEKERGLVLRVHPTGRRAFKLVYSRGRPRRYHIGDVGRSDVRALMARIEAPVLGNMGKAAASAIFTWAVKMEIVAVNPCIGVDNNETRDRERVLSDSELPKFWAAFDSAGLVRSSALKVILLTGQRPGEVSCMRREHVRDGWWEMPGEPDHKLGWPGTKNGQAHRVWLPDAVRAVIADVDGGKGFVFGGKKAVTGLDAAMRDICAELRVNEKATPHDLRRTHGTMITRLRFGRDAMNRIQNHKEGGIASVYDRHEYAEENRKIMDTVSTHVVRLVEL